MRTTPLVGWAKTSPTCMAPAGPATMRMPTNPGPKPCCRSWKTTTPPKPARAKQPRSLPPATQPLSSRQCAKQQTHQRQNNPDRQSPKTTMTACSVDWTCLATTFTKNPSPSASQYANVTTISASAGTGAACSSGPRCRLLPWSCWSANTPSSISMTWPVARNGAPCISRPVMYSAATCPAAQTSPSCAVPIWWCAATRITPTP